MVDAEAAKVTFEPKLLGLRDRLGPARFGEVKAA